MDNLAKYENYEQYRDAVKKVLNRTVEDFVLTGYLLKQGRDTDILKGSGYANINEFAAAEYNLDASQVSRYIRINDKFSEGGYSDHLKEKYAGYGYAKLSIMLTMPETVTEELSPSLSKSEIQAVKEEIESEQAVSDIEVILEGEKEEQRELGNLEKALHQLFEDEPELFLALHGKAELEYIQEILAPEGEKIYSVRIQGVGRVMMFLREGDRVTVHKVRENEKEYYTWGDIIGYIKNIATDADGKERWEEIYGREFPEKQGIAPVQSVPAKQKQRKEPKVKKAKENRPEGNGEAEAGTVGASGEDKESETRTSPQKEETAEVLVAEENQTNDTVEAAEGQQSARNAVAAVGEEHTGQQAQKNGAETGKESAGQQAVKGAYGNRKEYIDKLAPETAARYIAEFVRNTPYAQINFAKTWEKWLTAEVDGNGEEIEIVE